MPKLNPWQALVALALLTACGSNNNSTFGDVVPEGGTGPTTGEAGCDLCGNNDAGFKPGSEAGAQCNPDPANYDIPGNACDDDGNGNGRLIVTPNGKNLAGDYAVRIIAQDDGDGGAGPRLVASEVFIVTVTSPDEAPVITPIADSVAVAGSAVALPVNASDFEQDPLTYTVTGLPPGATVTQTQVYGKAVLAWQPGSADIGTYTVTVRVADDGHGGATAPKSDSTSFTLTVRASDQAPLLDPVGARGKNEGPRIVERNADFATGLGKDSAEVVTPRRFPIGEPAGNALKPWPPQRLGLRPFHQRRKMLGADAAQRRHNVGR